MFRPPAAPRSLKVTFVAFLVSDAQRYNVMLLVEAVHLWSGLVHLDKDVYTNQLWLLSSFPHVCSYQLNFMCLIIEVSSEKQ